MRSKQKMRVARAMRRINRRAKKLGLTPLEYMTRILIKRFS